jgi:hypothetical protein
VLDLSAVEVIMEADEVVPRVALTDRYFTAIEIDTLGRLINGLGIIGSQLIQRRHWGQEGPCYLGPSEWER